MSDAQILLAGVIGHPISHSKSPALHGHWLRRYGIAGHYIPMDVAPEDLREVLQALPKMGFKGVNVTVPHKENALKIADVVSDRAALIGAANTLTFRQDGRIHADNTDGYGFIASLQQVIPDWDAATGPAIVLGAGGAARAVISALIEEGAPKITLANRTKARAETLRSEFGAKIKVVDWTRIGPALAEAEIVVNTTVLGMTGKPELKLSLEKLRTGTVVCDLVYTPLKTAFLAAAEQQGARTVDGLGMLLHQAAPGFERWFDQTPDVDDELRDAVLGA